MIPWRYILMLTVSGLTGFTFSGKAQTVIHDADSATIFYQHEAYQKALDIWYDLEAMGETSAAIYYNIGVSESILQNTPAAILAFEKGKRLAPLHREINKALAEERNKIESATIPVPPFFLLTWYEAILSIMRPGYWALIGLSLLLILVGNELASKNKNSYRAFIKGRLKWFFAFLSLLFLLFAMFAYRELYKENEAIVFSKCDFRQAPSAESPEIRTLYPGEKVALHDQIGDWVQVYLLNQDAGWIKKECLTHIRLPRK